MAVIALRRFSFRAWRMLRRPAIFAAPILLTLLLTAAIAWFPVLVAGLSWTTALKSAIALPAAAAIVYVHRRRRLADLLLGFYGLALMGFVFGGLDQHDAVFDLVGCSMLVLGAWLYVPYVRDWKVRLPSPADLARSRAKIDVEGRIRAVSPTEARRRRVLGVLALIVAALIAVFATAQPSRAAFPLRLVELFADALLGGAAMLYVARRLGGNLAGVAAAFAWICAPVRWEYASVQDLSIAPTALIPAVVAVALRLRESGTVRGAWLAAVLAVVLAIVSIWWPLLALCASITVTAALFALGDGVEARWTALTVAVCLISCAFSGAVAGRAAQLLGGQTAFVDPSHALVACASACDGALPWEFLYPSGFASAYAPLVSGLFTATQHWGNYQVFAIGPGWAQVLLAVAGIVVLERTAKIAPSRAALVAIAIGVFLALPSHYLGLELPSLTRILTAVVPTFEFGAQFAIVAAFFVAMLAGAGFAGVARGLAGTRRTVALAALGVFIAFDVAALPVHGHPGAVLAATDLAPSTGEGAAPTVAFYPMLTADYGAAYEDLVRVARRQGARLLNETSDATALADLSAPDTLERLRARGIRTVIVALGDYPRRSEILRTGHVLLPEDQDWNPSAWIAPDPTTLSRSNLATRSDGNGTLILTL